ncbi:MAG TPA: bifunctional aspartate kinase/diaminopimelate decarboxylase [Sandaracinaceae bacterium LLY-WYZ-13_1]|nr:bifunctional aspartate kinase/diaminopimelate decarboxylase [Sandaracinaceae bacterium LLY-WYZ-13_1]
MSNTDWVVLKFGGTSVASFERWKTIASVLRERIEEGLTPLVVCSALSGISNLLERLLADAEAGRDVSDVLEEIFQKHRALAKDMGLDADELVGERFEELSRIAEGVRLVEEATPRLRARAMSMGELMSTRLGAAWLSTQGLTAAWQDAREMLVAEPAVPTGRQETRYLSTTCSDDPDPELEARLAGLGADVIVTQGFIARDAAGDTVLLGRGGSDTSAAYFAARVTANRLEIWTDVPGMFTSNPRRIPSARLLRHLDYAEAEQLALMGAKVLHPRCIAPVAARGIPLHIKCTPAPDMNGTVISRDAPAGVPLVKAVSSREGIPVISIDVDRALENVGHLARVARCFEQRGLSIDMVSASETNITISLDPAANVLGEDEIEALMSDLNEVTRARLLGPGAAVSLVGSNIRAILHELGPILERFEDHRVYMVSQAADDLNFTFVVAEEAADPLVSDVHALLFGSNVIDASFGPPWEQLFEATPEEPKVLESWWQDRREALLAEAERGTPCYVYRPSAIDAALEELRLLPIERLLYSVKANPNPDVLRHLHDRGVSFQCGSVGELERLSELFEDAGERIVFTGHGTVADDYRRAFELGAQVVVGSETPLRAWPEVFEGREIFLRVDPGRSASGRHFVLTAGPQSKLGIAPDGVKAAHERARAAGAKVVGLHAHPGSGLRSTSTWRAIARLLIGLAKDLPDVRVLDLGGGLGVPERVGHGDVNLTMLAAGLASIREEAPNLELWMEPGRFLVARAGVLLAHVRDVADKEGKTFITIDAGMNALVRPAIYGAWHETVNLTRYDEPRRIIADVVGPLSDSADVLANDRLHPETKPGDVFLIANAGAYGRAMASEYNSMPLPREVIDAEE